MGHWTLVRVTRGRPRRISSRGPSRSALSLTRISPKVSTSMSTGKLSRRALPVIAFGIETESSVATLPSTHPTPISWGDGAARVLGGRDCQMHARARLRLLRGSQARRRRPRRGHEMGADPGTYTHLRVETK